VKRKYVFFAMRAPQRRSGTSAQLRKRQAIKPTQQKPMSIIAQVDDSGMAPMLLGAKYCEGVVQASSINPVGDVNRRGIITGGAK
jgi:hypothetical protein